MIIDPAVEYLYVLKETSDELVNVYNALGKNICEFTEVIITYKVVFRSIFRSLDRKLKI